MSEHVRVVKGAVVIEDRFAEPERELLTRRYRSRKVVELWRTRHRSFDFLKDLPHLEDLSLIRVKVDDPRALSEIRTLKRLFLNGLNPGSGWDFLADLTQVEELHLLNVRGPLTLPDLQRLDHLATFRVWGCKGLADVSALEKTPRLEEVWLTDTALTPDLVLPLLEKPSVRYLSSSFPRRRDDELFQEYLARYGKVQWRESP
ncbi:hypothetical protein [Cellulomonas sp. P5_C5]